MGNVHFNILKTDCGTTYIGTKNNTKITNIDYHTNTLFNLDMAQSAYFTILIEGFEYDRFYTAYMSTTKSENDGIRNRGFDHFTGNSSIYWMPIKSIQISQGALENVSLAVGAFADLQIPFRRHLPTLTVEMSDHRSE